MKCSNISHPSRKWYQRAKLKQPSGECSGFKIFQDWVDKGRINIGPTTKQIAILLLTKTQHPDEPLSHVGRDSLCFTCQCGLRCTLWCPLPGSCPIPLRASWPNSTAAPEEMEQVAIVYACTRLRSCSSSRAL